MNHFRDENSPSCYFHPKEIFVGVCPLCLKERLLVLASKQAKHKSSSSSSPSSGRGSGNHRSALSLPKIFAFSSILNRFEFRQWRSDYPDDHDASTSQEDSFISIKFEENGVASWDKGTVSKVSLEHCSMSWSHHAMAKEKEAQKEPSKSVIEAPRPRGSLRWRRRIGQLLHLVRLKRSSSCRVATKVEGVKVRKQGWIKTLTKRRSKK